MTIKGTFTSVWSDGEEISTSSVLDVKTGFLDTEISDDLSDHGSLLSENFVAENGDEYKVCHCCHEHVLKTAMVSKGKSLVEVDVCSDKDCEYNS